MKTRFAPSPTGNLHIGSVRTALFNYLFAKSNKGKFILRIEDTDRERSKPIYEKDIIDSLKWLGIEWDEGPFNQSERTDIYEKHLKKLLDEKKAYYCFCSSLELEAKRQDQMARGEAPKYDGKCSNLPREDIEKNLSEGKSCVIRLRVPKVKIAFNDLIRGKIEMDSSLIGDFVVAKDLKTPLFHFAVVIDDELMDITHVIRGEDHISNTPKQILLQEALGFKKPSYAHIPLILAPDRSKLSKRHGATSVLEYRTMGYLPEAIINFLAFLGWNPGTEKEIFSLKELGKEFSLDKVQKAGAIFNQQRLDFLNGFYIRQLSVKELAKRCKEYIGDHPDLEGILSLYQSRIKRLDELAQETDFFYKDDISYQKELLRWKEMTDSDLASTLEKLETILTGIPEKNWNLKNIQNILLLEAERFNNRGELLWPFRVALTGKKHSAGPFEVSAILGREKTLKRVKAARLL